MQFCFDFTYQDMQAAAPRKKLTLAEADFSALLKRLRAMWTDIGKIVAITSAAELRPAAVNELDKLTVQLNRWWAANLGASASSPPLVFPHRYAASIVHCTYNIHKLVHLGACIRQHGPLRAYWTYPFERMNNVNAKSVHRRNAHGGALLCYRMPPALTPLQTR